MMQIVQQTKEEKIKMYLKLSKKELAEMLWAANLILENSARIVENPNPPGTWTMPSSPYNICQTFTQYP